jgi:hypothetical protein
MGIIRTNASRVEPLYLDFIDAGTSLGSIVGVAK